MGHHGFSTKFLFLLERLRISRSRSLAFKILSITFMFLFVHEEADYVKYSATASIGAAVFPADGNNFETLYKSADQALYKAKRRGKNQLAFYDDRERQE